ncbi:hypothetical protein CNMCM5793_007520 [Aspergillus hiratsukae]|uniref:Uncharacterized protein n=1 Tax=Aspergillus hiratsukae TaxID=1194566 RepID=A0A8H6P5T6_9EURO|nr:hypothetical protein CNMCM5793_007520 [Aspergillus hiratsukae]KAF7166034.1 hypothetical protein CNMCM6106_001975 [Aspergillus hiratsukae]
MRVSLFTIVIALSSYALAFPGFWPSEDGGCDLVRCNAQCCESGADAGYCSDDSPSEWRHGVTVMGRSSPHYNGLHLQYDCHYHNYCFYVYLDCNVHNYIDNYRNYLHCLHYYKYSN